MTVPLVVLAIGALAGGLLNLPFSDDTKFLERWLDPVVGAFSHDLTLSTGMLWLLAIISTVVALAGIGLGWLVYLRQKLRPFEPPFLYNGWYYDSAIAAFVAGPGEDSFDDVVWFDEHVVDGGVTGIATVTRFSGRQLRKLQSGYMRNYALGIGLGAVLLLAWFVSRGVF
jgi:NADH-quinone oxidoreductase subunit L